VPEDTKRLVGSGGVHVATHRCEATRTPARARRIRLREPTVVFEQADASNLPWKVMEVGEQRSQRLAVEVERALVEIDAHDQVLLPADDEAPPQSPQVSRGAAVRDAPAHQVAPKGLRRCGCTDDQRDRFSAPLRSHVAFKAKGVPRRSSIPAARSSSSFVTTSRGRF
jgi:hypothetical protein